MCVAGMNLVPSPCTLRGGEGKGEVRAHIAAYSRWSVPAAHRPLIRPSATFSPELLGGEGMVFRRQTRCDAIALNTNCEFGYEVLLR
jgi:hypothetical protein